MSDVTPAGPEASLEAELIRDYLRGHGVDPDTLRDLPEAEARQWMRQAASYASAKMTELESRARLVHHFLEAHGPGGP